MGLRVVGVAVDHLDAVQPARLEQFLVDGEPFLDPARPAGVVPKDECALVEGSLDGFFEIVLVQRIGVIEEDGIEVPRRHLPGDLRTAYQQQTAGVRIELRQLVGPIVLRRDVLTVGLVLDMIGDRKRVEALPPGFLDADRRPDGSVGEHRVHMQIAYDGDVTRHLGNADLLAHTNLSLGHAAEHQYQCEHKIQNQRRFPELLIHGSPSQFIPSSRVIIIPHASQQKPQRD